MHLQKNYSSTVIQYLISVCLLSHIPIHYPDEYINNNLLDGIDYRINISTYLTIIGVANIAFFLIFDLVKVSDLLRLYPIQV